MELERFVRECILAFIQKYKTVEKQQKYYVLTQCHLHKRESERKRVHIQFANCLDVIIIAIMKMHIFNGLQRYRHSHEETNDFSY